MIRSATTMWWLSTSRTSAQDRVILTVNDKPVRGENGKFKQVVSVKSYRDGRVQVCFDDGSTRELLLADYSADGTTPDNMGVEQFAEHLKRRFPTLTNAPVQGTKMPHKSSPSTPAQPSPPKNEGHWKRNLLVGLICAPLAVGAAVVALPAIGFTAGGIAAGSYAAGMMSSAAVASGGGVAAGSLVATLQAAGAAGLGAGATAAVAGTGAAAGASAAYVAGKVEDQLKKTSDEKKK
ncbi:interferon alpha-inducible protein 27-like protein 2B [Patiria miniata]|uniref:Uncharacterized protein n=1 Tax=Patiria miniata TaxID=46514 RepID=A0A913ZFD2_PATMI|nr:interferon alpha-inducible protein 27-like protein 2B [Patiria miniata]